MQSYVFEITQKKIEKHIYSLLYLPTYLPFPVFFISLWGFELFSDVICFQPEGFFSVSCKIGLLTMNSLSLCSSGKDFILL